jgi:site-specific recombinase XerD
MRRAASVVSLSPLLESFFDKRLIEQQNVSQNTVDSYKYIWRMFLRYLTGVKKKPRAQLMLNDVTAETLLDFFNYIESERKCCIRTRNQRRAMFRSFAKHVILNEPQYMQQFQRIMAIPSKRYERKVLSFLTRTEIDAILATFDMNTQLGRRDYTLLMLMYNTGARVSEIASVRCCDIGIARITIHGKGSKDRIMPIWPETVELIKTLMTAESLSSDQHLFLNNRGQPITRSGITYVLDEAVKTAAKTCCSLQGRKISPHIIRHTTAMHLLQSGVDINQIRMWLGHVHLDTTHGYIEADLDMKRQALEKGGILKPDTGLFPQITDDIKAYLATLGIR